jgi:hypothetical protein
MNGKCQVEGCQKPWKYKLNRTEQDGSKTWLKVCIGHELEIGNINEKRCYCPKHTDEPLFMGVCFQCDKERKMRQT